MSTGKERDSLRPSHDNQEPSISLTSIYLLEANETNAAYSVEVQVAW